MTALWLLLISKWCANASITWPRGVSLFLALCVLAMCQGHGCDHKRWAMRPDLQHKPYGALTVWFRDKCWSPSTDVRSQGLREVAELGEWGNVWRKFGWKWYTYQLNVTELERSPTQKGDSTNTNTTLPGRHKKWIGNSESLVSYNKHIIRLYVIRPQQLWLGQEHDDRIDTNKTYFSSYTGIWYFY